MSEETDEYFYLTESGFKKSRTAKRPCERERLDVDSMSKIKGLPWNPTGTRGSDQGNLRPTKGRTSQWQAPVLDASPSPWLTSSVQRMFVRSVAHGVPVTFRNASSDLRV